TQTPVIKMNVLPPTNLIYKWLDAFTVKVSWVMPSNLPNHCDIKYLCLENLTNYKQSFLTKDLDSEHWTVYIWTVSECNDRVNGSSPATINVYPHKPRGELVKDFKCVIYSNTLNCSWIPKNKSLNLTVSYRNCGRLEESINGLKKCDQLYSSAERNGCIMHVGKNHEDTCIVVETVAAMSTFKPKLVLPPPKLTIKEDSDRLILSITPPMSGSDICWIFNICYNITVKELSVSYNKRCLYEFQSKTLASPTCVDEPPDRTLIVVAIAIPLILSICVILSCYCFRRHSNVFFPVIPDPSVIFKEMMMNGNKEHKTTTGSLYTPVPECIEPCKIIPIP
uniref:Type I cytokine receptor cytokine-binding domain-containing protein n=1 Tax=Mola mola TaxID=94237 RepID=A0A3Q3X2D7_MOLML